MTSKKRKTLIIISVAAVLLITTVITVFAYLGSTDNKSNQFTLGKVGENTANVSQIQESFTPPAVLENSNSTDKKVWVKNNSNTPAFARLFVDFSDKDVRDKAKIVVKDTNGTDIVGSPFTWSDFLSKAKNEGINGWKYVDTGNLSGYFYYTTVLDAGGETSQLFDGVNTDFLGSGTVATGLTEADYIKNFDIIVYSEIVQVTETDSQGSIYNDTQWQTAWQSFLKVS